MCNVLKSFHPNSTRMFAWLCLSTRVYPSSLSVSCLSAPLWCPGAWAVVYPRHPWASHRAHHLSSGSCVAPGSCQSHPGPQGDNIPGAQSVSDIKCVNCKLSYQWLWVTEKWIYLRRWEAVKISQLIGNKYLVHCINVTSKVPLAYYRLYLCQVLRWVWAEGRISCVVVFCHCIVSWWCLRWRYRMIYVCKSRLD